MGPESIVKLRQCLDSCQCALSSEHARSPFCNSRSPYCNSSSPYCNCSMPRIPAGQRARFCALGYVVTECAALWAIAPQPHIPKRSNLVTEGASLPCPLHESANHNKKKDNDRWSGSEVAPACSQSPAEDVGLFCGRGGGGWRVSKACLENVSFFVP